MGFGTNSNKARYQSSFKQLDRAGVDAMIVPAICGETFSACIPSDAYFKVLSLLTTVWLEAKVHRMHQSNAHFYANKVNCSHGNNKYAENGNGDANLQRHWLEYCNETRQ